MPPSPRIDQSCFCHPWRTLLLSSVVPKLSSKGCFIANSQTGYTQVSFWSRGKICLTSSMIAMMSPLGKRAGRFVCCPLIQDWGFLSLLFFCYYVTPQQYSIHLSPPHYLHDLWREWNWYKTEVHVAWCALNNKVQSSLSLTQKSHIFCQHPSNCGWSTW